MLSGKRSFIVLSLALLALAGLAYISTHVSAQGKKKTIVIPSTGKPPTLSLTAEPSYVTACAGQTGGRASQVALVANAKSDQGTGLRYKWTTFDVGTIVGDGPNTTWDLTGVQPGTYRARVDVDSGREQDCAAFTTTTVTVLPCPPPTCPGITLSCPSAAPSTGPVTFSAAVTGGPAGITPVYNWTVSAGRIIGGQGTPTIQVETAGLAGQPITATLDVAGYNLSCSRTCTVQVPTPPLNPTKFDEFPNIRFNDEKARLDNFAIQLQGEPSAQGYIIVYPGARDRAGDSQRRANRARDYLVNTRGIDTGRIFILQGGRRADQTVELWIVPNGATPPTPTP